MEISGELTAELQGLAKFKPNSPARDESALVKAVSAIPQAEKDDEVSEVVPTHFGTYEVLNSIKSGGMGTVYRVRHTELNRVFALKTIRSDRAEDEELLSRFRREWKMAGSVVHPNVVQATDAGQEAGTHYLVMEYVEGYDVSQIVRELGALSVADACEITRQAAFGLAHAHQQNLVHRDIKPSNLMVDNEGVVKVLDLGIARLMTPTSAEAEVTNTGQVLGTAEFMAPEQIDESSQVNQRADIYSLGCTLYYLLTGQPPFTRDRYPSLYKMLQAQMQETPPSVLDSRGGVPDELVEFMERILSKSAEDRPTTMLEVSETLAPFASSNRLDSLSDQLSEALSKTAEASASQPTYLLPDSAGHSNASAPANVSQSPLLKSKQHWKKHLKITFVAVATLLLGAVIFLQSSKATVKVTIHEDNYDLRVNGQELTVRKDGNDIVTLRLHPGKNEIEVVANGFETWETTVNLKRFGSAFLTAEFVREKSPAPPIPANSVKTNPPTQTAKAQLTPADVITKSGREVWEPGSSSDVLPGLVAQPAEFDSERQWNVIRTGPTKTIRALNWNSNGRYVAVADESHYLRVYELAERKLQLKTILPALKGDVISAAQWSPDGKWLATTGRGSRVNAEVQLWDAETFARGPTWPLNSSSGQAITWRPDSQFIAAVSDRGGILVRNLKEEASEVIAKEHGPFINIAWSTDGTMIAARSNTPHRVIIFNLAGEPRQELGVQENPIRSDLKWSPEGRWLAHGGTHHNHPFTHLWNTRTWENRKREYTADNQALPWSSDGHRIATINRHGHSAQTIVAIRDIEDFTVVKTIWLPFTLPGMEVQISWSPDNNWMVASNNGTLYLCDVDPETTEENVTALQMLGGEQTIRGAAWSSNGSHFSAALGDGTTRTWLSSGQPISSFQTHFINTPSSVSSNQDGRQIAVTYRHAHNKSKVRVFDVDSGATVQELKNVAAEIVAWSPDGTWIAMLDGVGNGEDSKIRIWNPETGESRFFRGHSIEREDSVRFAWNSMSTKFASATDDKTLRIWNLDEASEIAVVELPDIPFDIRWSNDGGHVAITCQHHLLLVDSQSGATIWHESTGRYWRDSGVWFMENGNIASIRDGVFIERDPATGQVSSDQQLAGLLPARSRPASPDSLLLGNLSDPLQVWETSGKTMLWLGVPVSREETASFTPAGQLINPDPEVEKHLRWIIKNENGSLDLLTRTEFLKRQVSLIK